MIAALCALALAAAGPIGVPAPEVTGAIETADSVVVCALGDRWEPGDARAELYGRQVLAVERAGARWQRHAAQILSDVVLYQDRAPGWRHLSDARRSRYVVTFLGARDTVTALLLLAEPCVEIRDRSGLAGRGIPDPMRWNALLELAKEAFPGDAALRGLRLIPRVREEYGFVDTLPVPLAGRAAPPDYPRAARDAGIEGTVLVQTRVGADGRVREAHVIHSIPALDAAAVAAVVRWRFAPARSRGRPVACWVAVPVEFRLH